MLRPKPQNPTWDKKTIKNWKFRLSRREDALIELVNLLIWPRILEPAKPRNYGDHHDNEMATKRVEVICAFLLSSLCAYIFYTSSFTICYSVSLAP